jgi:hypothetical protein
MNNPQQQPIWPVKINYTKITQEETGFDHLEEFWIPINCTLKGSTPNKEPANVERNLLSQTPNQTK